MLFVIVMTVYWGALATWFGGVLFVAVMAPVVFRTVEESKPILPMVLSVNLEGQHGSLLAGTIVGNILKLLARVQIGCAAALYLSMGAQWLLLPEQIKFNQVTTLLLVRSALLVGATILLIYDRRAISPRMWRARNEYLESADDPDVANPAKERFDRYHRENVSLLAMILSLLAGLILFSAAIIQPAIY